MKIRKNENSYNLVCFYPGRAPQKAISKSTVRTFIASANRKHGQSYTFESSTTLFFPALVFIFVFKLFVQASHYIKDNRWFHWVYKPFILNIFYRISKSFSREGKQFTPLTSLVAKLKEIVCKQKHWKFKIAMKGIYFFFCVYDNRPWHFFRCRYFVLFGWTFSCHFLGRVHRIFSLLCLSKNL